MKYCPASTIAKIGVKIGKRDGIMVIQKKVGNS